VTRGKCAIRTLIGKKEKALHDKGAILAAEKNALYKINVHEITNYI